MTFTVPQIIGIEKISQYLVIHDIKTGGLDGGGQDLLLPRKLYCIRKGVEFIYNISPSESSLYATSSYLLALCAPYSLQAEYILNNGSGGGVSPISPIIPSPYLIPIGSSDFSDATHYNNPEIVGKNLVIFWNDVNRYIYSPSEWQTTATGIVINIAGFDATQNDYHLYIYILDT